MYVDIYLSIDSGVSQSYKKTESFSFIFFCISGWDIDLDYCDVEWFALEMNQNHSVIFEIAPRYCILDSC